MGINPNMYEKLADPLSYQASEYGPQRLSQWIKAGERPQTSLVQPKKENGVLVPTGFDINYFGDFGNYKRAIMDVPIKKAGTYLSLAYNTKQRIEDFMQRSYMASAEPNLDSLYAKLKAHARKNGLKSNFDIGWFGAGFTANEEYGGVFKWKDKDAFIMNPKFNKMAHSLAQQYNTSHEAAAKYIMAHEFMHLFGIGASPKDEANLERVLADFAAQEYKNVKEAREFNKNRKIDLERVVAGIYKIAAHRKEFVEQLYRERGPQYFEGRASMQEYKALVSHYVKEAVEKGMKTEKAIMSYAQRKAKNGQKARKQKKGKVHQMKRARKKAA